MNLSIVKLYLKILNGKKRRKLNKDFERKIYSSKKCGTSFSKYL